MKTTLFSVSLSALLTACAHPPQAPTPAQSPPRAEQPAPALPNVELTDRLLYQFLLGDIAAQRNRPELAAQVYLDLARTTRDPRVARRAAQLAFNAKQYDLSLQALRLWQELEPDSPQARQMLVSLLLSSGRLEEARPHVMELLAADPEQIGNGFLKLHSLLMRVPDKMAVLDWLSGVVAPYPQVAEAHWALAQAAAAAGKPEQALAEARQAYALRPEWDLAVMLQAQLMQSSQPQQATALLAQHLRAHPDQQSVRLFYARLLLEQKQYRLAREEFTRLLQQRPGNADIAFAIAMASVQLGEMERAEQALRAALAANGKKDENALSFYLGQLSEAKPDEAAALKYYRQVKDGEYHFEAQLRIANLLHKQGQTEQARALLRQIKAKNAGQRVQQLLIEAQWLREAKRYAEGFKLLTDGLEEIPDQPELLYQAAMLAEKLKKYDTFETMLYRLIKLQPDNAHAYNALGYSWLERNERIAAAMALVQKAYALKPDDAAIMDSVGWGHFRLGELEQSEFFLRRAYAANPDPEIAAHLGEVLWVKGQRKEAEAIWRDSAKVHPDNEVLQDVMRRFLP